MTDRKEWEQITDKELRPTSKQISKLERIDRTYFTKQIQQVFNLDSGFLYTAKEFLLRPGKSIQEYLFENRAQHVKPIVFLIFTSIIFSLISYFLKIEYSYFNVNKIQGLQDKLSTGDLGEWLNNNIGYTNLIIGLFMAPWIKVFARSYNIYEIIVMLCFILGEATLILTFAFVMGEISNSGFIVLGIMLIFFLYPIWAIGQFFGKKNWRNYFKSLLVIILGYTSYFFIFILIGFFWKMIQG